MTESLEGDWLLIGGAYVALWSDPRRTTEDIDLVGLEKSQDQRLRLMQFADDAGLPVETVNSAADFLVRRIDGWEDEIEIFRQGARTRIYRPKATLFLLLKIHRLSEQDLDDCLAVLAKARGESEHVDTGRVLRVLDSLGEPRDAEIRDRRARLREILHTSSD